MKLVNRSFRAAQRGFFTAKTAAGTALATIALAAMSSPVFAGGTPGGAIAAGLADGETEMGLVFAAVAVLIGLLLVWTYIKRSAR